MQELKRFIIGEIRFNENLSQFKHVKELLSVNKDGIIMKSDQIVIPSSLQTAVIKYAHEGHLGINLCKRLLRNRCWFPSIDSMVEAEVKDCLACQANTDTTHFNPNIPTSSQMGSSGD